MIHLHANDYLLRKGDAPTCGFIIERGHLEVVLEHPDGDHVLARLGPGEIVGEMALIDQAPRTASVRACEECLLLPITADHIGKRLATADPILRLVLTTILERFRTTLHGVSGHTSPARVPAANHLFNVAALAELRLEKELEIALKEGQIRIYYQPVIRLSDGRLAGFEALARWPHSDRGLIPPTIFVPIAEASGLSSDLAVACLQQVARDLVPLREQAAACCEHVDDPHVSINVSGHDLTAPAFIDRLDDALASPGGVRGITLELTETALVQSPSLAAEALQRARDLGFKIAVDDFGTGYSSLNYVRTLPIDSLKIDKSFVQGASDCATTRSIVASMLQLADSLGLRVVGEGIETTEQHALLNMLGCNFGQGYLFGRPLPLAQTLEVMASWRSIRSGAQAICSSL